MIIQHNMCALNADRQLRTSTKKSSKSTEKLSTGYRINRAADDAAGLAISEKMRGQIRGMNQASTNSEDGISLIQTAEGALQESQNIIQRMRELAVQAANDTNTDEDRENIQGEIDQLTMEVDRIANSTEFNTKKLINGDQTGHLSYQEGNLKIDTSIKNGIAGVDLDGSGDAISFGKFALTGVTVIRITINKAFTDTSEAKLTGGYVTISGLNNYLDVTLTGGAAPSITISASPMAYTSADLTGDGTGAGSFSINLTNVKNLQAGDVITITIGGTVKETAMQEGKESLRLQTGANSGQEVELGISSMKAKDLGIVQTADDDDVGAALDVTSQHKAAMAISLYDYALTTISSERSKLGAVQNRLEHSIANLDVSSENLQASESRIRDVDMASEMTEYSKNNILMQAGQSVLTQANQSTQGVLNLLQQ